MTTVDVHFVIASDRFDSDGFIYATEVERVDPARWSGPWAPAGGGFAIVVDGILWNSYDQPWNKGSANRDRYFDPAHVRLPLDSLSYAALFVTDLAMLYVERPYTCAFHEMTSVEISFVTPRDVRLVGTYGDRIVFQPVEVPFDALVGGIVEAGELFVRIAGPFATTHDHRSVIDDFRSALDRLRAARTP
jgi:hypothetical protein